MKRRMARAFTLIELLVVMGIIALLISILLPAVRRAHKQAQNVECKSNLRQIGIEMEMYGNNNRGRLFPCGPKGVNGVPTTLGTNVKPWLRWPVYVFEFSGGLPPPPLPDPGDPYPYEVVAQWTPRIMLCPTDVEPQDAHSYILNKHLADKDVKRGTTNLGGVTTSEVVVMGEKVSSRGDYYMEIEYAPDGTPNPSEFYEAVEHFRHGLEWGSNYLYMDMHVESKPPKEGAAGLDPWNLNRPGAAPLPAPPGP